MGWQYVEDFTLETMRQLLPMRLVGYIVGSEAFDTAIILSKEATNVMGVVGHFNTPTMFEAP
jgi:hypothetical protein